MTATAARTAVQTEIHECLRTRVADSEQLAALLTQLALGALGRAGYEVLPSVRRETGLCRYCRRQVALTRFGRLWMHGPPEDRCDGSSTWPTSDPGTEIP